MRKTKFKFADKEIDPQNSTALKANLKKEPFFTSTNATLLNGYFFIREYLHEIIKDNTNDNITVSGSSSFPAYMKPFRIPTDLDLIADDQEKALQLIFDTASKINKEDDNIKINLSLKGKTSADVIQLKGSTELNKMISHFKIDITPSGDMVEKQKALLRKIISNDEEFVIQIEPFEAMVSNKIFSILRKLTENKIPYYRTKDFYDIYMFMQSKKINIDKVNQAFTRELGKEITSGPKYDKYRLANVKENLPQITKNFEWLWTKMSTNFEVDKTIDPQNVRKTGIDLINEMSL